MTELKSTKEYGKFKFLTINRKLSYRRIDTMAADPDFAKNIGAFPILVTMDFEIIDGQHRFGACKKLNIPVPYIQSKDITIDSMRIINSQSASWNLHNFVNYFVSLGNQAYVEFERHLKMFPLTAGYLLLFWSYFDGVAHPLWTRNFRLGKINLDNFKQVDKCYKDIIGDIHHIMQTQIASASRKVLFQTYYIQALIELWDLEPEKYRRVMDKLPTYHLYLPLPRNKDEAQKYLTSMASKKMHSMMR